MACRQTQETEGVFGARDGAVMEELDQKMGKICSPKKSKHSTVNFQYSPKSYALNFAGDDREDNLDLLQSFPTRFAPAFVINDNQTRKPPSMWLIIVACIYISSYFMIY